MIMQNKIKNKLFPLVLPLLFLGIWMKIRLITFDKGFYPDEMDNFAIGWLITKGRILYKDIFSHHFPLMYYISAFIELFVHKLIIYRYFMVFYALIFWILMIKILDKEIRKATIICLPLISWSLILFGGQQFSSETFFAYSLLGFYLMFINKLWQDKKLSFSKPELLLLAYFMFTTIANSIIYSLSFLPFFAIYFYQNKKDSLNKTNLKYFFLPNIIGTAVFIFYYLLKNALYPAFWSLFVFNAEFYAIRYGITGPKFPGLIKKFIIDFLNHFYQLSKTLVIVGSTYLKALKGISLDFIKTLDFQTFKKHLFMINEQNYNQLFTFEFFVFVFILLGLFVFLKKKKLQALALSAFFLFSARLRFGEKFHITAFYIYSFWLAGFFAVYAIKQLKKKKILPFLFLCFLLFAYYTKNRPEFKFSTSFILKDPYPKVTQYIKENTDKNAKITQVNLTTSVFYFPDRIPANILIYYYPWMDWPKRLNNAMLDTIRNKKADIFLFNQSAYDNYQNKFPGSYQEILTELEEKYTPVSNTNFDNIRMLKPR